MKANLVIPKNKLLQKFIQYFFFIENADKTYENTFVCYPNTNYCLGLHRGNEVIKLSDSEYKVAISNNFHSYLSGIYQKPMSINYSGKFRGVWINFEPLGLEMLSGEKVSDNTFSMDVIEELFPNKWLEIYDLAFENENPNACAEKLENFFLDNLPSKNKFKYIPFNELEFERIEDLKDVYNKSYRSIYRIYKDSLNVSPKEFGNIQRLRKSINHIHSPHSLTTIAYESGFADQSHMIRNFKKFTGLSPKKFRKESNIVNQKLCWTIS